MIAATPEDIAGAIMFVLSRVAHQYTIVVTLDDRGCAFANAALLAGEIDGFVHVFSTAAGIAVSQSARTSAADAWLVGRLQFLEQLGATEVPVGARA